MATVIALFDAFSTAQRAVRSLLEEKIEQDNISLIANNEDNQASLYLQELKNQNSDGNGEESAEVGASIGAVIGGVGGILAGLGALVIPVVGPILAAGPIAAALGGLAGAGVGALAGGAAGGLIAALVDAGVPADAAGLYAEGIRRGGTLVVVRTSDEQEDQVRGIIERHNPVDVGEHAEEDETVFSSLQSSEQTDDIEPGFREEYLNSPFAQSDSPDHPQPGFLYGYSQAVSANYAERDWDAARQDLQKEWAGNGYGPWVAFEGAIQEGYVQGHQRAEKELAEHDEEFRQHYRSSALSHPSGYENFRPAYQFGWHQALKAGSENVAWEEASENLRNEWQVRNGDTWDEHKEAIRFGWERNRSGDRLSGNGSDQPEDRLASIYRAHFKSHHPKETLPFEQLEHAYRFGADSAQNSGFEGSEWKQVEDRIRAQWELENGQEWDQVRDYVQFAWNMAKQAANPRIDVSASNHQKESRL